MTQSSNATAKPRHPPTDWLDGTSTEQDGVVDQSSFERRLRLEAELARQQVTEIAAARQRHDLCGMCAIAAAVLHARLVKHGLHAWFVVWHGDGHGHCYVECGDYLIDITASQFGRNEIEIVRKDAKPDEVYWQGQIPFGHLHQLRAHLTCQGWTEDQPP